MALAKQSCDVRMLAEAFEWAGGTAAGRAASRNTAFNITNGDAMVWTRCVDIIARTAHYESFTRSTGYNDYNHLNGDAMVWASVYPAIAALFGMEVMELYNHALAFFSCSTCTRFLFFSSHRARPLRRDRRRCPCVLSPSEVLLPPARPHLLLA